MIFRNYSAFLSSRQTAEISSWSQFWQNVQTFLGKLTKFAANYKTFLAHIREKSKMELMNSEITALAFRADKPQRFRHDINFNKFSKHFCGNLQNEIYTYLWNFPDASKYKTETCSWWCLETTTFFFRVDYQFWFLLCKIDIFFLCILKQNSTYKIEPNLSLLDNFTATINQRDWALKNLKVLTWSSSRHREKLM